MEYAGAAVPKRVERSWRRLTHERVVGLAEISPLALATYTWRALLRGREVLSFVDNPSAVEIGNRSFVSGTATTESPCLAATVARSEGLDTQGAGREFVWRRRREVSWDCGPEMVCTIYVGELETIQNIEKC